MWAARYRALEYGRFHAGDEGLYSGPSSTPEYDPQTRLLYTLGADGKRREADFTVPASLCESELCQYLSDLFHESASSTQPLVTRLD